LPIWVLTSSVFADKAAAMTRHDTDISPVGEPLSLDALEAVCRQLKALGHPARLDIVRQLVDRDRCCCGDFCATLQLAQSTVSQHLEQLCRAGLVEYEPEGNRSRYSLNRTAFVALAQAISGLSRREQSDE